MFLSGTFCQFDKLAHLTQLCLFDCDVRCTADCDFVSVLEELRLVSSHLQGLHEQGLSACCQLKRLRVNDSYLRDRQQNVLDAEWIFHSNFAVITGLELLEIKIECATEPPMHWISQLVSLRSLELTPLSFERYTLHHLLTLTNLTNLDLSTDLPGEEAEDHICLDVHWQQLQSLKRLSVIGVQASLRRTAWALCNWRAWQRSLLILCPLTAWAWHILLTSFIGLVSLA